MKLKVCVTAFLFSIFQALRAESPYIQGVLQEGDNIFPELKPLNYYDYVTMQLETILPSVISTMSSKPDGAKKPSVLFFELTTPSGSGVQGSGSSFEQIVEQESKEVEKSREEEEEEEEEKEEFLVPTKENVTSTVMKIKEELQIRQNRPSPHQIHKRIRWFGTYSSGASQCFSFSIFIELAVFVALPILVSYQ